METTDNGIKVEYVEDLGEEDEILPKIEGRDDKGRFTPGHAPLSNGRPKGTISFKEFAKRWFMELPDEAKEAYLLSLEDKRPGFALVMGEGNPTEDKQITVKTPTPILGGISQERIASTQNEQISPEQVQNEALHASVSDEITGGAT